MGKKTEREGAEIRQESVLKKDEDGRVEGMAREKRLIDSNDKVKGRNLIRKIL